MAHNFPEIRHSDQSYEFSKSLKRTTSLQEKHRILPSRKIALIGLKANHHRPTLSVPTTISMPLIKIKMMDDITQVFPFKVPDADDLHHEAIKWSVGNTKYEFHAPTLGHPHEIENVLPHCLNVKAKIDAIACNEAHKGPSIYRVFPRTISPASRGVWQQLMDDAPEESGLSFVGQPGPVFPTERFRFFP